MNSSTSLRSVDASLTDVVSWREESSGTGLSGPSTLSSGSSSDSMISPGGLFRIGDSSAGGTQASLVSTVILTGMPGASSVGSGGGEGGGGKTLKLRSCSIKSLRSVFSSLFHTMASFFLYSNSFVMVPFVPAAGIWIWVGRVDLWFSPVDLRGSCSSLSAWLLLSQVTPVGSTSATLPMSSAGSVKIEEAHDSSSMITERPAL
mmetsp:Transcript_18834/g.52625  ORF Transcript_18834/g.52625 Transcript_18834/m.52625 type:complete len:204 (+) Transcript_18834:898-1509(+)